MHVRFAPVRGTAQHRLQVPTWSRRPNQIGRVFQVNQAGLEDTIGPLAEEYMLGIEATMHLSGRVQLARQPANRPENRPAPLFGQVVPGRQPGVQVLPTVQGTGQEDRLALSADRLLGEERRLQGGNAQRPVALDVAELAGEGRLAQRMAQAAGQVVALALQVVGGVAQVEAVDAAPATPFGIRFVHGVQLQGPQGVEAVQTVALEQVVVLRGDENAHSRPSKKATTWRIRFLSDSFRCRRRRYCR